MQSEFEVRVLDINEEEFSKKIEVLGGKFINKYNQVRYVYDFNPKIENKWIRLRTDGIKTTLAIKEYKDTSIGGTKEIEIEVSDMKKADEILEELGYKKRSIQENKRVRYMLDNVEIDIDTWPHLNTYVEFEGKSKEAVIKLLDKLEIKLEETTTMDAQDIYLSKGYTLEDLNNLKMENLKIHNLKEKQEFIEEVAIHTEIEWGEEFTTPERFDERVNSKIEKIKTGLDDENYCKLILLKDEKLIGFVSIFPYDSDERKDLSPWYATMFVKEEERGKGYSKILNDAILDEARKRGFKKIYLKTDLENYYEKFGAKYIETLKSGEKLLCFELLNTYS